MTKSQESLSCCDHAPIPRSQEEKNSVVCIHSKEHTYALSYVNCDCVVDFNVGIFQTLRCCYESGVCAILGFI